MLTDLQSKLLEMLKWWHHYCENNNYTYYIMYGTMLGAARHKGFIPWDDDIDVAMPRKDYDRLRMSFRQPVDHYIIESPYDRNKDYTYPNMKLYDTSTTMIEPTKYGCRRGVFIDIFPLDGIGNNIDESRDNYRKIDRRYMFIASRTVAIRKERSLIKNAAVIAARLIPPFIINDTQLLIKFDKKCAELQTDDYLYICNKMSTYRSKEIMRKEIFGKPKLYDFEDTRVYGVEKYDDFLRQLYGDWRKLPPVEKQHTAHEFKFLDLDHSYLE